MSCPAREARTLAEELRQRDPNVALPHYVSEIVWAAEAARGNEKIVEGPGYDRG